MPQPVRPDAVLAHSRRYALPFARTCQVFLWCGAISHCNAHHPSEQAEADRRAEGKGARRAAEARRVQLETKIQLGDGELGCRGRRVEV